MTTLHEIRAEYELAEKNGNDWEDVTLLHDHIGILLNNIEKLEARLDAVLSATKEHVADLRKTADTLEVWQTPMGGPFDATIAEIRKAADELKALGGDNGDA